MISKKAEIAFNKGYRVKGNSIYSPLGKRRKLNKTQGYPRFNISNNGKSFCVKCHQLAGYQKFKEKIYGEEIVIRHLDDNLNNFRLSNIALGCMEDNVGDRYVNNILQHWIEEVNKEANEVLESEVPF